MTTTYSQGNFLFRKSGPSKNQHYKYHKGAPPIQQIQQDSPDLIQKETATEQPEPEISKVGSFYESITLKNTLDNFQAGKTSLFKNAWFKITNDSWIRNTISTGYKVEFEDKSFIPKPLKFSCEEQQKIDKEIARFLQCKIIEKVDKVEDNEFISNIFFRPKKGGRVRIILNLKSFNTS